MSVTTSRSLHSVIKKQRKYIICVTGDFVRYTIKR